MGLVVVFMWLVWMWVKGLRAKPQELVGFNGTSLMLHASQGTSLATFLLLWLKWFLGNVWSIVLGFSSIHCRFFIFSWTVLPSPPKAFHAMNVCFCAKLIKVENAQWKGGKIVKLESLPTRVTASDCADNYIFLRPVLLHSPDRVAWSLYKLTVFTFEGIMALLGKKVIDLESEEHIIFSYHHLKVPSGYFLTDVWLYMDMLLKANLLKDPQKKLSKLDLAADEGVKLKRLTGGIRTLWRSSENAHNPRVTELKALLRPSPRKNVVWHGICKPKFSCFGYTFGRLTVVKPIHLVSLSRLYVEGEKIATKLTSFLLVWFV